MELSIVAEIGAEEGVYREKSTSCALIFITVVDNEVSAVCN